MLRKRLVRYGDIYQFQKIMLCDLLIVRAGIQGQDVLYSWFATTFEVPSEWNSDRILLNFDAIDYEATIFINGQNASFHRGGYFAFTVDVTDHLASSGANEL